jgi:hypothetical protein
VPTAFPRATATWGRYEAGSGLPAEDKHVGRRCPNRQRRDSALRSRAGGQSGLRIKKKEEHRAPAQPRQPTFTQGWPRAQREAPTNRREPCHIQPDLLVAVHQHFMAEPLDWAKIDISAVCAEQNGYLLGHVLRRGPGGRSWGARFADQRGSARNKAKAAVSCVVGPSSPLQPPLTGRSIREAPVVGRGSVFLGGSHRAVTNPQRP